MGMTNKVLAEPSTLSDTINISEKLTTYFSNRMKLLVVDDSEITLSYIEGFFSTPLINVSTVSNSNDAFSLIAESPLLWHCWIIDINLGMRENDGLDIIERHKTFPFTIVFSGMGSMETAVKAMELGAAEVVDKKPEAINKLILKTCKLMPLSLLCKGRLQKNRNIFFLLKENIIKDHNEWALSANLSLRQLQNICNLYAGMPPTFVLPFYYGLQYLLLSSFEAFSLPPEYSANQEFFQNCLTFLEQNLPYYQILLK